MDQAIATSTSQSASALARPQTMSIPGLSHSSVVWSKALEMAKKKLSNNNLPPLDLSNLTPQSAEENIEAVINALSILQKDAKKGGGWYPWHKREGVLVERFENIIRTVEKHSKALGTAIQSPPVSALFWASVWAILRVCIYIIYCVDIPKLC